MPTCSRLATAGSVDDGKSTLIGRLLYDSKALMSDQSPTPRSTSRGSPTACAPSASRASRSTSPTASSPPRGARSSSPTPRATSSYTRNMVTGASHRRRRRRADRRAQRRGRAVAPPRLPLRAARHPPHRRVVNKMDLVDWDEAGFRAIERDFGELMQQLGVPDGGVIPVSALHGDYVVEPSDRAPWYDGPPLLSRLEELEVARDRNLDDPRLPVQWVVRATTTAATPAASRAASCGRATRSLVLPQGERTTIERIDTFDGPVEAAFPPHVGHRRARRRPRRRPRPPDLRARRRADRRAPARRAAVLDGRRAGRDGSRYVLKHTTRRVRARSSRSTGGSTSRRCRTSPTAELELNDIGRLHVDLAAPVMAEPYARNRDTGAFILVDETTNATVGAGDGAGGARGPGTADRPAQPGHRLARAGAAAPRALVDPGHARRHRLAHRPPRLRQVDDRRGARARARRRRPARLPARRRERPPRALRRPRLLARRPPRARPPRGERRAHDRRRRPRRRGRARLPRRRRPRGRAPLHDEAGLDFVEAWVDTPLEECERRDPHGLYARARAGTL